MVMNFRKEERILDLGRELTMAMPLLLLMKTLLLAFYIPLANEFLQSVGARKSDSKVRLAHGYLCKCKHMQLLWPYNAFLLVIPKH